MRGLSVYIYRNDLGDCTHNGVSSPRRAQGKTFVIFDEALNGGNYRLDECRDDPSIVCLKVVRRWVGEPNEYLHLEPMFGNPEGRCGPMFGGNYVGCSDSRFGALSRYPLPVHDRFETKEAYEDLTR